MLGIQSNIPGRLSVWLFDQGGQAVSRLQRDIHPGETFRLLSMVSHVLKHRRPSRIVFVRGPGPFTPVRTGFVVAQTLGQIWSIPVTGLVGGHELTAAAWQTAIRRRSAKSGPLSLRPFYGRAPNISRPRKRGVRRRAGRARARTALR